MRRALALTALLPSLLAGCGSGGGGKSTTTAPASGARLRLTSPAFQAGATIPTLYTCAGRNVSPPLTWSKPPSGTKALILTLIDPDAPGGGFGHWGVILRADQRGLSAGQQIGTSVNNDSGKPGYTGPCPPPGESPHHYVFRLYGVKQAPQGNTVAAIDRAAAQNPLATGRLTGRFGR